MGYYFIMQLTVFNRLLENLTVLITFSFRPVIAIAYHQAGK